MTRLTARNKKGFAYYPQCFQEPCCGSGCQKDRCEFSERACETLAAYEETGLTPDQIRQMDKLYVEKCQEVNELKKRIDWIGSKQGWIPAGTKPEKIGGYICTLSGELCGQEEPFVGMNWYANGLWDDDDSVIAWMPAPEPYVVKDDHTTKNDMEIKIHLHADIEMPQKIEGGDWIDLRAAEDVFIPAGEYRLISLGVSMELPQGYEAHVVPRSSTFKNFGIISTNHMGVIDNSYYGDNDIWHFPAYCCESRCVVNGKSGTKIHKNDRICQFRIIKKQPEIEFVLVDKLENEDRGGIGSTGIR